ncbi:MAG: hypothetical protein QM632_01095 [Micrococcaceae bacterium]
MPTLNPQLQDVIEQIAQQEHFIIQSVSFEDGAPQRLEVIVDVDKDEAVTLDEISDFSTKLSQALDQQDVSDSEYLLEVFSPGADTPLTQERHFKRAIGKIVLVDTVDTSYRGVLESIDPDKIVLDNKPKMVRGKAPKKSEQGLVNIDRDSITHAVIELPNS